MRIVLSVRRSVDGWTAVLSVPSRRLPDRPVAAHVAEDGRWWPRLPDDPPDLFHRLSSRVLTSGTVTQQEAQEYGAYLFDAFIGPENWEAVGAGSVELALSFPVDDSDLHRQVWELMYDTTAGHFLALDPRRAAAIVRQVEPAGPADGPPPLTGELPRVLAAVSTVITDPLVRPGAETIGVLRGMQHDGGVVNVRTVDRRSVAEWSDDYRRFKPHVVHLVAPAAWADLERRPVLTMRRQPDTKPSGVTAADLVAAMRDPRLPHVFVLNACEAGALDGVTPLELPGPALAAELSAAGIPIVVVVQGAVADVACRLFVRVLGACVAEGLPIIAATARARAVAFEFPDGRLPAPVDWALPVVYAAAHLPVDHQPMDKRVQQRIRGHIESLGFTERPVLCGREEFFEFADRLLTPSGELSVLIIRSRQPDIKAGGTRLLQDLAGYALRRGHVPCIVGPFHNHPPTTEAQLALQIVKSIADTRTALGLDAYADSATVRHIFKKLHGDERRLEPEEIDDEIEELLADLASADSPPRLNPRTIATRLRTDLIDLVEQVHAERLLPRSFTASPVLLLDDVHEYGEATLKLCDMIDRDGLPANKARERLTKIPVILFAKASAGYLGETSGRLAEQLNGRQYVQLTELQLFRDMAAARGLLAWQWMLLHPEAGGPGQVLTPRPGRESLWHGEARSLMEVSSAVYDAPRLLELAGKGHRGEWFYEDDDARILKDGGLRPWSRR